MAALLPLLLLLSLAASAGSQPIGVEVTRLPGNPIIRPGMDPRMGTNINGPSLIRVPEWVRDPLGRYYLYFAHHKGDYIRLAYADSVPGPWTVHPPGCLDLADSGFPTEPPEIESLPAATRRRIAAAEARGIEAGPYAHIASPEAIVVPERRQVFLYYHGLESDGSQTTRVAVSRDGLQFEARPEPITGPYLRVFRWQGWFYGLAMPGVLYRSRDGLSDFEVGPSLFNPDMRHSALLVDGERLLVFWTQAGHAPERILLSVIELGPDRHDPDWRDWRASEPTMVLAPEEPWEGAGLPIAPSLRGAALEPVRQLRDPAVFEEEGRRYLLYSVAGERGIALAQLELR